MTASFCLLFFVPGLNGRERGRRLAGRLRMPSPFSRVRNFFLPSRLNVVCVRQRNQRPRHERPGFMQRIWILQSARPITRRVFTTQRLVRPVSTMTATATTTPTTTSTMTAGDDAPAAKPKLHGRAFYESIGSPKYIIAPMVDQSEFVRCPVPSLVFQPPSAN